MLLENVEVRSFRTIRHVDVSLTRGLNVIHGENDVGKSTLMEAIRACLTLRARGTGARYTSMQPRTGGDPEVCVAFSQGDVTYSVRKKFGKRGTVHLNIRPASGAGRDLSGDEAEHELRCALGLSDEPSRRGGDLGILPVLWVDQGTSGDLPPLDGQGATALGDRLRVLSGEVIAGENGERIFEAIEEAFSAAFSLRGPRTGSGQQIATESCAAAEAQLQTLESRHGELDLAAGRFNDIAVRLRSVRSSLPVLGIAADGAEHELQATREREAERAKASAELEVATAVVAHASERHRRRMNEREAEAEARKRVTARQAEHLAASTHLAGHDSERGPLDARLTEALAIEVREREDATAAQRTAHRIEALRELATLDDKSARCRACDIDRLEAARRIAAEPIDETALANIERLHREADIASASLEVSATTLEVRASERISILLDGEELCLAPGEDVTRTVAAPATLRHRALEVTIQPGGANLEQLRLRAQASQKALSGALGLVGASSIKEARERAATRRECEQDRVGAGRMLSAIAPEGLASIEARRAELLEGLDSSTAASGADAQDLAAARKAARDASHRADEARRACEQAGQKLKAFDVERDRRYGDVRVAVEALSGAEQTVGRAETALATSVVAIGTDDALVAAHAEVLASRRAAEGRLRDIDATLSKSAVADAEDRFRRSKSALAAARAEEEQLARESCRLEGELQAASIIGLDDRLEAARAHLDNERAQLQRLTDDAGALRLLFELLRDERAAAQKRFVAPLVREIQPLLNVMYPGGRIEVDEHFAVVRLEREGDGSHVFEELGGGSKEQLAIIVRLAMARVLGAGAPLPVMLDDAIVFTSEARFARMSEVLVAAASGLQLLVFTCHWDRYRALGPDHVIDLEHARLCGEASPEHAA